MISIFDKSLHAIYDYNIYHKYKMTNNKYPTLLVSASQPSSGDVRLVGATFSNVTGGRVEIYHNGAWGTVCDDYWDINEGKVVCKQLGFTDAIQVYSNAYFGRGSGTIWMHNIQCNGTEAKLEDCPHNGWGTTSCSHYEDAGVSCQPFHLNSKLSQHLISPFNI